MLVLRGNLKASRKHALHGVRIHTMAWTAPWALAEPTPTYMLELLLTISAVAIGLSAVFQTSKSPSGLLQKCGVSLQRVARAVREVERKMVR